MMQTHFGGCTGLMSFPTTCCNVRLNAGRGIDWAYISRRVLVTLRNISTTNSGNDWLTHFNGPNARSTAQVQDSVRVRTNWREVQLASTCYHAVVNKIQAIQFNLGQCQT